MKLARQFFFIFLISLFILAAAPDSYSASLTTTFAGGNGQDGNMFEITALQPVVITGFDGNLDLPSDNFLIYYKTGTYTGFEDNPGAWTLVGTANGVVSNGEDVATPIPIPVNITIPAGQTYSFYITTDGTGNGIGYTDGSAEHAVYVSDANIQILEGIGVEYPFGATYSPRIWNGTVYYNIAITAVPTMNELGMILFVLLAGVASVYYLRRKKEA